MEDLFYKEQLIYDNAVKRIDQMQGGSLSSVDEYVCLAEEYGKLLKQLRMITRFSDRTTGNLNASNLDLSDKIHYDALTGVYNRRYLEDSLNRIIKTMLRLGGSMLSMLMIDVDFFKNYNDTYGHSRGDVCLKSIAGAIIGSINRDDDFVARYGGEEFVVVLPNTDEEGTHILAEKILKNVVACAIPHEKSSVSNFVTVSIGGTTGSVALSLSGDDFIRRADEAMYISKQTGRNKYTFLNL